MTTTKAQELIKKLNILGSVNSSNYKLMQLVYEEVKNNKVVVKSKEWCDPWKNQKPEFYPLDLKKFNNWITYNTCVDLVFTNTKKAGFICDVIIYDGRLLDGMRENKRFKATILLDISFITSLEHLINGKVKYELVNHPNGTVTLERIK